VKRTYLAAAVIAAAFIIWVLSGQIGGPEGAGPAPSLAEARARENSLAEDAPVRVRAQVLQSLPVSAEVVVRGRTAVERFVDVRSETRGRVVELLAEKGDHVAAGAPLCRLDEEARPALLAESQAQLKQAEIDHQGSLKLQREGLLSDAAVAATATRLASAKALVQQRERELANTMIRAPFSGEVETRPVEEGDLLQLGAICARVIDSDPMLLVGEVSENEVAELSLGAIAHGTLITGEKVEGTLRFIGRSANSRTRTFRVEVAVPNPEGRLRDGVTTEVILPVAEHEAHLIPAAILALDDAGALNIRIVDPNKRVRMVPVTIVKEEPEGLWVTGLPATATVITVGQELVTPGNLVEVTYEDASAGFGQPTPTLGQ
jgi:multidrug efflux system membrane fusion protein